MRATFTPPPVLSGRTFTVTINGEAREAREGETLAACARRHGVHVPTLGGQMDDLDHTPGTCRVCVVEVLASGATDPMIVTACNTPVQDGMDVRTRSRRVRELQKLQVELLLADHHQDCATCIRHGNCELQDVAQYVGLRTTPLHAVARRRSARGRLVARADPRHDEVHPLPALHRDVPRRGRRGRARRDRHRPGHGGRPARRARSATRRASRAGSACSCARPARSVSATRSRRSSTS